MLGFQLRQELIKKEKKMLSPFKEILSTAAPRLSDGIVSNRTGVPGEDGEIILPQLRLSESTITERLPEARGSTGGLEEIDSALGDNSPENREPGGSLLEEDRLSLILDEIARMSEEGASREIISFVRDETPLDRTWAPDIRSDADAGFGMVELAVSGFAAGHRGDHGHGHGHHQGHGHGHDHGDDYQQVADSGASGSGSGMASVRFDHAASDPALVPASRSNFQADFEAESHADRMIYRFLDMEAAGGRLPDPDTYQTNRKDARGEGYHIDLDFTSSGANFAPETKAYVIRAAEKLSSYITGNLPLASANGETFDDIGIEVTARPEDGEGGVFARAGPLFARPDTFLPGKGTLIFDEADLREAERSGDDYGSLVLHELMHAVGWGTIFDNEGRVADSGTSTPSFVGRDALEKFEYEFPDLFSRNDAYDGIPLDGVAHLPEADFDKEIMTPFVDRDSYVSDMSIAMLEDLGYDTIV